MNRPRLPATSKSDHPEDLVAAQDAPKHTTSWGQGPLLAPEEHVLSTLERDGSRRWLYPKLSTGAWWKRRRVVAYVLMVIFVAIPHLRIGGKPLVLLDIANREFTVFGRTFLPTDTLVLALLILSVFVSIVLITALVGRAWCGWACPQTVYMEFLFRPIDRLFEGTKGKGGQPRGARSLPKQAGRFVIYLALCMFLAHTFLSYFVGTEQLSQWVRSSPFEHPLAFFVMALTTGLMIFDFMFFREQLCVIACPYGRFQSVMLDQQSLIVGYDPVRGEPRKKGKRVAGETAGDCVDCNQCVVVCPTGIDIRKGLQMECINCTQCIDACDDVMDRVGKPRGLIRYSSQDSLARKPNRFLRARTIIYPVVLLLVFGGFVYAVSTKAGFDARPLSGRGAPFTVIAPGEVSKSFRMRLVNRTSQAQVYQFSHQSDAAIQIEVLDRQQLTLSAGANRLVPFNVIFPPRLTRGSGTHRFAVEIEDQSGNRRSVPITLLGPS